MKTLFHSFAFAVTAVAICLPTPAPGAQTPPAVSVHHCSLYAPASAKWPMRRLRLEVRNTSQRTADMVSISVGAVGEMSVHGRFMPGNVTIEDIALGNRFATADLRTFECSVIAVHLTEADVAAGKLSQ